MPANANQVTKDHFAMVVVRRPIVLAATLPLLLLLLCARDQSSNVLRPVEGASAEEPQSPQATARAAADAAAGQQAEDGSVAAAVSALSKPQDYSQAERDSRLDDAVAAADRETYFKMDASMSGLRGLDCHFRNVDLCVAGLLGTMAKGLPETDDQFEMRCDEMKATTNCLRVFLEKCGSDRFMAMLAPFGALERRRPGAFVAQLMGGRAQAEELESTQINPSLEAIAMNLTPEEQRKQADQAPIRYKTLIDLCEPSGKRDPANARVRKQLFKLSKCINERMPFVLPCVNDLKNAFIVFFESPRKLPKEPTCCAFSRFQSCLMDAFDSVCGLNSMQAIISQLEYTILPMQAIGRVCGKALDHKSEYCTTILPPPGAKVPMPKKSSRVSRIAKALDMLSLSPATSQ